MDIMRKIAALIVCAALMLVSLPAVSAEPADSGYITGEFRYMPSLTENSILETFYYTDGFFAKSGKEKDIHLRTMSLDLALSVFGSEEGTMPSESAENLLADIGFDTGGIYVADMNVPTSENTLGTVISHKNTPYGEVVAVAVRGGGYGLEWASNLMVGESGDAEGFSKAAKMLIDRIRAYEIKYGIAGAKIWMAGYSRAGGVAELAGKYINEHLAEFGMTDDDLYIYTFEAPAGSCENVAYENIHNVVNPNDIVPLVYPAEWRLYHTGVTETLNASQIPIPRKEVGVGLTGLSLRTQRNYEFDPDTFSVKDLGPVPAVYISEFIHEYIGWLASNISRKTYADNDEYAADMISLIIGNSIYGRSEFTEFLFAAILNGLDADMLPILYAASDSEEYNEAVDQFIDRITESIIKNDAEEKLTAEEAAKLRAAVPNVIRMIMPAFTNDLLGERPLSTFATFMGSSSRILMQHSETVVLALVKAEDPFFGNAAEAAVTSTPVTEKAPESSVSSAGETTTAADTTVTTTSGTTVTTTATTSGTTVTTTATTVTTSAVTTTTTEITSAPETATEITEDTTTAPVTTTAAVTAADEGTESTEKYGSWLIIGGAAGGILIIGISMLIVFHAKKRR